MHRGTAWTREGAAVLALLLAAAFLAGCGRGSAAEEARRERAAYARTVERIHENLLTVMARRAPDLVAPLAPEDIGGQGSVQDLHERFERSLASLESNCLDLEAEIADLERTIEERRSAPMPYETPDEAHLRKWSLYYEITRVQSLDWRQR